MPTADDLSPNLSYTELAALVDQHGEPFDTVDQCRLYLRAAGMLRRRVPEEHEQGGERMRTRDIDVGMKEARKCMNILLLSCQKPQVIVPGELG